MSISKELNERCQGNCEICSSAPAVNEYIVSPKKGTSINDNVALCAGCNAALDASNYNALKGFAEGSIWNPVAPLQALSYRIIQGAAGEEEAVSAASSAGLDEEVIQWGASALIQAPVHKDAFGNVLENGDNVVLTQALDVKGTNFTASKGTVVKKIKLVSDNHEHIEGKINEQSIVILTKYVKKS
ncbi:MAG: PhnA domain-containing protein [Bacteroidia bacterium]|nr:PhnA domain-containing protein [Bacteroidia bacterium]